MTTQRHWLITAAAVIAALGAGFGAAQLTHRPAAPEAHGDDHAEEAGHEDEAALSLETALQSGVVIAPAARGGGGELKLPGRVAFAPGAEAAIDAPLPGTVIKVHVGLGDRVSAGQALATLRSPEGAASRAAVDAAAAAVEAAQAAERRDRTLFAQGWIAQARLDVTTAETRRAEAELRAARARTGAYGRPGADGLVVVRSPIAGLVTRLDAAPGRFLHEEALQVAAVADARRLELVFDAPPAAAGVIAVGDRIEGRLADETAISGAVIAVAPAGDSGGAVIRVRPSGEVPPAGTVISARIATGGGAVPVVPLEAVQRIEGRTAVFVVEGDALHVRPVVAGQVSGGRVEILSGLDGTERVAGQGAFLLKAELAKGEAEHGH